MQCNCSALCGSLYRSAPWPRVSGLRARRFLLESLSVIARERSDEAIQTKLLKAFVWIGSQGECEAFVRAGSQEEGVGRASARPTTTETVECDPSFRMAERVSPLRPLSMMAFRPPPKAATASRSSLTKVSAVKELPPCEQWLNSEVSWRDDPVEAVVSHPEPPPIWRPNQRIREPAQQ